MQMWWLPVSWRLKSRTCDEGGGVDISWRTDGAFVSNKPAIPDGIFSAGCGKG
jgi:hypothetical protein